MHVQQVKQRLRKNHVDERVKKIKAGHGIDWATAESLAIGTLLLQGALWYILTHIQIHMHIHIHIHIHTFRHTLCTYSIFLLQLCRF